MKELYSKIFDAASKNMQENGMELGISFESFQTIIAKDPKIIDANEFNMSDPKELFTSIIFRCENRFPNSGEWMEYEKLFEKVQGDILSIKYVLLLKCRESQRFIFYNRSITGLKELKKELNKKRGLGTAFRLSHEKICGECKRLLYKYILSHVWENLSVENKNKIRAIMKREEKPW